MYFYLEGWDVADRKKKNEERKVAKIRSIVVDSSHWFGKIATDLISILPNQWD